MIVDDMRIPILFIFNGLTKQGGKVGVSGGDIRLVEIMKNTKDRQVEILTTPNGIEFLEKYGVRYEKGHMINHVVGSDARSNLVVSLKSFFWLPGSLSNYAGDVYSSCEHLYDVLPALRLKLLNKCRWYAVYHWVEGYPWKEKRGGTPFLRRYLYWLNRWFSGFIIKVFADSILAVSDQTKEKLLRIKKVDGKKVQAVYCGVNYREIRDISEKYSDEKGKMYDAVYMKRLNHGKGVFDLLEIWRLVCKEKPDAKLVVIGDGPDDVVREIRSIIDRNGLQENIILKGVVYDFEEKFRILNSSRLFVLPSHEENWAIVIGEAMAIELPVLAYDLREIHPIWQDNVEWIKLGDVTGFSVRILDYLRDDEIRHNLSEGSLRFIRKYDWNEIARKEFNVNL